MRMCRNGLHQIKGPADRRPGGNCIHCSRASQRRYHLALREARRQLAVLAGETA